MAPASSFSKFAEAFSDNFTKTSGELESPEQLVQALRKDKSSKKLHLEKKRTRPQDAVPQYIPKESEKGAIKREKKDSQLVAVTERLKNEGEAELVVTVDESSLPKPYEDRKSSASANRRGGRRNNRRGGRNAAKMADNDAAYGETGPRVFDRHSGMVKTSVKPSTKVHGRDDNDWKQGIIRDSVAGEVKVSPPTHSIKISDRTSRRSRGYAGASRRSRGGARNDRTSETTATTTTQHRTDTHEAPAEPANAHSNRRSYREAPLKSNHSPKNVNGGDFIFDANDFPSFDA